MLKTMITVFSCLFWLFFSLKEVSQTYFVSPNGKDTNDGKSPAKTWKTIEKVSQMALKAGLRFGSRKR